MFAENGRGMSWYLNQVLPNLTHLYTGPRTIRWSPLCSPLYVDCLATSLPRLKHMTAGVFATRVQTILDILTLKSAGLVLQFGYMSYYDLMYLKPVNRVAQNSSGLVHLKVDASGVSKGGLRGLSLRTDKELHFEGEAAPGIAAWEITTSNVRMYVANNLLAICHGAQGVRSTHWLFASFTSPGLSWLLLLLSLGICPHLQQLDRRCAVAVWHIALNV
jgi:hypothetical protein